MNLKYVDAKVVFREVPDEITLAINISNCPCHCKGCHSAYLAEDIGEPLTKNTLDDLIKINDGITCVCFMGGDIAPEQVRNLAKYIKTEYTGLKTAWYSGRNHTPPIKNICTPLEVLRYFDYVKLGAYKQELGGLDSPKTNQIFYEITPLGICDLTYRFQNKNRNTST